MGSKEGLTLRQRALSGLEQSTKMLEVAARLIRQGNVREASKVQKEARTLRTISTLLMAEANKIETTLSAHAYSDSGRLQWY